MNTEQAQNILIQVARLAQKAGVLSLEDANAVLQAITVLSPKVEEVKEDDKPKKK